MTFKKTFYNKLHEGHIIFLNEGARNIHEHPFCSHNNKGKGKWHMMMVSYTKRNAEGDVPMQPEGEPNLDKIAQQVQKLFKLKKFYDHMNFSPE